MLKQNAQILMDVCGNYEKILSEKPTNPEKIRQFRLQFLYLLTAIDKLVKEEKKNAR